jgi:SnoaL-like domain
VNDLKGWYVAYCGLTAAGGAMSDESARLDVVRRYWEYPGADVDRAHEISHDDAVVEFPQSGERFEGVAGFTEWRSQYPADDVRYRVRRITAGGDLVVSEVSVSYNGAAGAEPPPRRAQVGVVPSAVDEGSERELVQHRWRDGDGVRRRECRSHRGWRDQPAQAERRRQRLADRAEQEDPARIHPLHDGDRVVVVAELGVVVVLYDEAVHLAGPAH